jgi:hypothetical protein
VYFAVFSVVVMEKCCDGRRDGYYYSRSGFPASEGAGVWAASIAVDLFSVSGNTGVWEASTTVDRKSMGHTMADRSSNEADFVCILLHLAWRFWKGVVTLAVTGNTISGRVIPCQRVPEFHWYRLLLTASRFYELWPTHRRTKPISVYFLYLAWRFG